jgi:hypothetical protein
MKRLAAISVVSMLVIATAVAASANQTPTLVLGGAKVNQVNPAANDTYLTWNQNSIGKPNHYDTYSSTLPLGSPPVKMNRPGSSGYSAGITGNTTESIYQEVDNRASNLYMFDLATQVRTDPPVGINTTAWEWAPSISPGFIEFGRSPAVFKPNSPDKVMLYDRTAQTTTLLGRMPLGCLCIFPSQVSDQYATWYICDPNCRVWYYDIAAAKVHRLKDPLGFQQYSPSIDGATGTLYYIQSHNACGAAVKLVRWTIGTPVSSTVVVSGIPSGQDVLTTSDAIDLSGNDNIYFDQQKCSGTYYADIYEVASANTATATKIPLGRSLMPAAPKLHSRMGAIAPPLR